MSIVLDEIKWAESAIAEQKLGRKPTETLRRVAQYYLYTGEDKRGVKNLLEDFIIRCDPLASVSGWSDALDRVIKSAKKYPPIKIDGVVITKPEIERIGTIKSVRVRKLAFALLCVAKYYHAVNEQIDYWVSTPDSEMMAMANVIAPIKEQSAMFGELKNMGFIRFSKRIDNLSVQVLFAEDGDTALFVSDFRNLGYQYSNYVGGGYYVCENCGITSKCTRGAKKKSKYCRSCAEKIRIQQNVNSVMRLRIAKNNNVGI